MKTHGMCYTRLYSIWQHMKNRCNQPKAHNYKYYGGRGITVCEEWQESFEKFHDWAVTHGYSKELTIDRKDVNGNYEPDNCRWATKLEQELNKRK